MENPAIDPRHLDAIADADPYPYWYDDADEPDANPTLVRTESCDLCIVGGGYTGLWTAIIARNATRRATSSSSTPTKWAQQRADATVASWRPR